jgi:alcohol dehydrogenase
MKAVVFSEPQGPLTVETVADPVAPPNGVVIDVKANGVCRSDWHAWMGHDPSITYPHVPGHEMSGVISEVGADLSGWSIGDRVTVPFSCGCGACAECDAGNTNICENEYQPGFSAWGSFAERVALPYANTNLVKLPDAIDFTTAASLGCRFMTAFHGLTSRVNVQPGEWVAIHGCGGVGLSAIQIAKALGAKVVAIDLDDEKLALAAKVGADVIVNGADESPVKAIRQATNGGAHVSVDALGAEVTAGNSIRCLRRRGRHLQIGLVLGEGRNLPIPMSRVIALELELYGSHGMPAHRYSELFELVLSGAVDLEAMVGRRISLEEAPAEIAAMGDFTQRGLSVVEL